MRDDVVKVSSRDHTLHVNPIRIHAQRMPSQIPKADFLPAPAIATLTRIRTVRFTDRLRAVLGSAVSTIAATLYKVGASRTSAWLLRHN
jgi:hypothetical protein